MTGPAASEMMKEIRNFPSAPPTDAEMSAAKTASIQSLPGRFETTGATASAMAGIFIFNRPLDYYRTLPARYGSVTTADVQRVAQHDLHPDNMIIVVAGDRAKIEPQIKAAKLGPVEVRNIDGELVTAK